MTKKELLKALEPFDEDEDAVVICEGLDGGWDNIVEVKLKGSSISIIFGGGSPFSDE